MNKLVCSLVNEKYTWTVSQYKHMMMDENLAIFKF